MLALLAWLAPAAHAQERGAEPLVAAQVEYVPPSGEPMTLYRRSVAVVIGIDSYPNLPQLTGARRDARQVGEYLKSAGFEVRMLLDGAATRQAITELVGDELPSTLQADDRVLIYFAGHGLSRGKDAEAMGYLMPFDGKREAPASTAISMAELQRWFAMYPARHVLYLADACYSGLAIGSRAVGMPPGTRDYVKEVVKRPVRIALVAGAAGQEAHEYRGNGLFTGFVLEGLRGAADSNRDGLVTTDELVSFVKPNVARVAASEMHSVQLPQLGRSGEGEFLFVMPKSPLAPVPERLPNQPKLPVADGAPLPADPSRLSDVTQPGEPSARLTVVCGAPQATVHIDDEHRPSPATFALDPGTYVVRCTAPDQLVAFEKLDVHGGVAQELNLPMRSRVPGPPTFAVHSDVRLGLIYELLPRATLVASPGTSGQTVSYTRYNAGDAIHPVQVDTSTEHLELLGARAAANPAGAELRWVAGSPTFAFSTAVAGSYASGLQIPATVRSGSGYSDYLGASNYELGDLRAGVAGTVTAAKTLRVSLDLLGRVSWRRLRPFAGLGLALGYTALDVNFKIGSVANQLTLSDVALQVPLLAGLDVLISPSFLVTAHYYSLLGDGRRGAIVSLGWIP